MHLFYGSWLRPGALLGDQFIESSANNGNESMFDTYCSLSVDVL